MGSRLELQDVLEDLLGSEHVYFQPPPDFVMSYPCIVYNLANIRAKHGDNLPYRHAKQYSVTVIDPDPDSTIPLKVCELSGSSFDRHFVSDNLNHDVINIIF